jgi:hypothetical protein
MPLFPAIIMVEKNDIIMVGNNGIIMALFQPSLMVFLMPL